MDSLFIKQVYHLMVCERRKLKSGKTDKRTELRPMQNQGRWADEISTKLYYYLCSQVSIQIR